MICAVTGCSYGDEGKGLTTDFLSSQSPRTLVVRHNGGAQSGHTVETDGKRFVFHELSSGSFRRADTFWADTFYPDLFKLEDELLSFQACGGYPVRVISSKKTNVTVIDDVLLNMAAETARGSGRHGSCGMGINEADCRVKAGFGINVGAVAGMTAEELFARLVSIRRDYVPLRLDSLGIDPAAAGEYGEMLASDGILRNYCEAVMRNMRYVRLSDDDGELLRSYENVIFETGQGLLLDSEYTPGLPNVTASRTGTQNPRSILARYSLRLDQAYYVTRSYLTRHGAGKLAGECSPSELGNITADRTNVPNPWQGTIRYARHASPDVLLDPVISDIYASSPAPQAFLVITHLNETDGRMVFMSGDMPAEEFAALEKVKNIFSGVITSRTPFAEDISV